MSIFAGKMLTAGRKKELRNLKQKKYRQRYGQFLVEGEKSVLELCNSNYPIQEILVTKTTFEKIGDKLDVSKLLIISEKEFEQISNQETPQGIIAVSNFKETLLEDVNFKNKIVLMLDGISDPGNMGTIIRVADWYGIDDIIASPDCVDIYNPKTISSTMGSFLRINVCYQRLETVLSDLSVESYACVMNGINVHSISKPNQGIIIIGNEANGVSESVLQIATHKITIPRYGMAESLNAAIATAIVCDSFIAR